MSKEKTFEERFNEEFVEIKSYRVFVDLEVGDKQKKGHPNGKKPIIRTYEDWKDKWDGGDQSNSSWVTPAIIKTFFCKQVKEIVEGIPFEGTNDFKTGARMMVGAVIKRLEKLDEL